MRVLLVGRGRTSKQQSALPVVRDRTHVLRSGGLGGQCPTGSQRGAVAAMRRNIPPVRDEIRRASGASVRSARARCADDRRQRGHGLGGRATASPTCLRVAAVPDHAQVPIPVTTPSGQLRPVHEPPTSRLGLLHRRGCFRAGRRRRASRWCAARCGS